MGEIFLVDSIISQSATLTLGRKLSHPQPLLPKKFHILFKEEYKLLRYTTTLGRTVEEDCHYPLENKTYGHMEIQIEN